MADGRVIWMTSDTTTTQTTEYPLHVLREYALLADGERGIRGRRNGSPAPGGTQAPVSSAPDKGPSGVAARVKATLVAVAYLAVRACPAGDASAATPTDEPPARS